MCNSCLLSSRLFLKIINILKPRFYIFVAPPKNGIKYRDAQNPRNKNTKKAPGLTPGPNANCPGCFMTLFCPSIWIVPSVRQTWLLPSNSLPSITSHVVQYIPRWLQLTTHSTLLVFHSRLLGRDLSPGTTNMEGNWSNTLQRPHRSGAQPHVGAITSRSISKQQLRRNTTPIWMEVCMAPVTKPAYQRRLRDRKHTSDRNRSRGDYLYLSTRSKFTWFPEDIMQRTRNAHFTNHRIKWVTQSALNPLPSPST
jgi:hypothetical protein